MRQYSALALALAGTVFLSACSSTKLDEKPQVVDQSSNASQNNSNGSSARDVATTTTLPANDANSNPALANRSVFFDFNSYIVKDEFKPIIEANSKYLENKKSHNIIIQGNTDERGGSEFNLALGQKRAEAVRKSLAALGVPDSQMEAVSFGKEKPRATGHDEESWAQNRRADIVYP